MNVRKFTATALALVIGLSSVAASAQPRDERGGRGGPPASHDRRDGPGHGHGHGPAFRPGHGPSHGPAHRPGMRPGEVRGHGPQARMGHDPRGRGVGPGHRFHRGDRLPPDLRSRHYVVDNWRAHRLSAPPRGHRWVQVDADYVLVAAATGLIASIILAH